jgi:NO-binding membrane sensor protein with MHYT domain
LVGVFGSSLTSFPTPLCRPSDAAAVSEIEMSEKSEDGTGFIQQWKVINIIASVGLSFLGTYTTTTLSEQYRVSQKMKNTSRKQFYLLAMALNTGGVAIWSMHFVGMGALVLRERSSQKIMEQYFDVVLTLLSMFCSIVSVYLGIYVASYDPFYRKEPAEIFAFIVERGTRSLSVADMQNPTVLWALTLFSDLQLIIFGGLITGFGVCLMHYVGMMSMTMNMAISWNASIVAASVIIACVAAIVANWILFRLLALYPKKEFLRIACAVVLCVAVCGMHYTGMAAADYHPLPLHTPSSHHWNLPLISNGYLPSQEAIFIALVFGLSLSWIFIMVALADLRRWHYSLRVDLNESRKVALSRGSQFDEDRLLRQSIDLGAHYDRLNESKPHWRGGSHPASVNLDAGAVSGDAGDCDSVLDTKGRRSRVHPLPQFSSAIVKLPPLSPPSPSLLQESSTDRRNLMLSKKSSVDSQSVPDQEFFPQSLLNEKEGLRWKGRGECSETIANSPTHEISVQSKTGRSQRSNKIHHGQPNGEDDEEEEEFERAGDEEV